MDRGVVPAAVARGNGPPAVSPLGPPALGTSAGRIAAARCSIATSRFRVAARATVRRIRRWWSICPAAANCLAATSFADGREDPYGKKKIETGSARHPKALHMQPFWAGRNDRATPWGW